jgi:hypothetical protein
VARLSKGFRIVCGNERVRGLGAVIANVGAWARISLRADRIASEAPMRHCYLAAGLEEGSVEVLSFKERLEVGTHIVSLTTRNEYVVTCCGQPLTEIEIQRLASDGGYTCVLND